MTIRNRLYLSQAFSEGKRPTGADFSDFIESYINQGDDGVSTDTDNNLVLSRGLQLGFSASTTEGTLRYDNSSGKVQYYDGSTWSELGSGGGGSVFQPVGTGNDVVYAAGNVGIGDFAAAPPSYRLEVNLGQDTGASERVRVGSLVLSNGAFADSVGDAFIYQRNQNSSTDFALSQVSSGEVRLNAPASNFLWLTQGGSTVRMAVTDTGSVVINSPTDLQGNQGSVFQVNGDAYKNNGQDTWDHSSDVRLKQDIRSLEYGLKELLHVRPVRYRFNGKADTPTDREYIGVIGQEIEKIFPEMVSKVKKSKDTESEFDDLRVYNSTALTYILINSVKELAGIVEEQKSIISKLEKAVNENGTKNKA